MENFDQQEISIEQIRKGLKSGIVWLAIKEGSIAAHIGDGWFWFSDKGEDISVFEFVSKYHDDIPEWIYQAINSEPIKEEKEDDSTEWLYYKAVLDEELNA